MVGVRWSLKKKHMERFRRLPSTLMSGSVRFLPYLTLQQYDQNRFAFEQKVLIVNPVFSKDNLLFLVKSFVKSEMFTTSGNTILSDYEVKTN